PPTPSTFPYTTLFRSVNFGRTFFGAALSDNPLIALEVWGAPISLPRRDPTNGNFIYQRFQRGIMHFDATTGRTQALLLADYLKRSEEHTSELQSRENL